MWPVRLSKPTEDEEDVAMFCFFTVLVCDSFEIEWLWNKIKGKRMVGSSTTGASRICIQYNKKN